MTTTVQVLTDEPIGTISPRLYGHFAEHLGRCCYDGLWLGHGRGVEGFHPAVVEALRRLPVPMLRWPGGCYADHYHWRDGIGDPAAGRPARDVVRAPGRGRQRARHPRVPRALPLLGAEPYLAGNVGSGTPQELCDWVEYCNATGQDDPRPRARRQRRAEPYGVRLWGVGNENWGCGGNYDADTYAKEYRRYATMLRHVDPRPSWSPAATTTPGTSSWSRPSATS
jgi:alpha-N-arabinofuranosidase